ncbi:unnamed protein product [Absidia cylindrospora]
MDTIKHHIDDCPCLFLPLHLGRWNQHTHTADAIFIDGYSQMSSGSWTRWCDWIGITLG